MTDSKARIDPRYDPRFQRGYAGSEADAPPHAASPPPGSPVVAPVPITREPREPREQREQRESRPVRLASDRPQVQTPPDVVERSAPSPFAPPADRVPVIRVPDAAREPTDAADPTDGDADPGPADPEPDSYARAWLISGWLFSGAILAGGLWWAWSAAIDPRYYTGLGGADAFMYLQWSVPPAMVMIGALGAVVVTTLAGLHQLAASVDRAADHRASAFPRVPAAYALVAIAIVGVILVVWLGGAVAAGQEVMWTESGPPDDQMTTVALSRVGEVSIGPIASAAFAAVIGLVVLGVQSARLLRPARSAR